MPQKAPQKILFFTCLDLPSDAKPTTGGSLRIHGLGQALKDHGHHVIYSVPRKLCNGTQGAGPLREFSHQVVDMGDIIKAVSPDIVIFNNWGLAASAPPCEVPVVLDINGSLILENYYRKRAGFMDDAITKLRALAKADLILAGSAAQKKYLTAWCLMAGFAVDNLTIEIVPFSLAPELPRPSHANEMKFVLAGYCWPWIDCQQSIEIVGSELEQSRGGWLDIYTDAPSYVDVLPGESSAGDNHNSLTCHHLARVRCRQPLPFESLVRELGQYSAAVDVWHHNLERDLAFSTRTATYLWAGLPVISSPFGEMAALIEKYNAGWLVDIDDAPAFRRVIRDIVSDPQMLTAYRQNARKLAKENLTWDKTTRPLERFCAAPFKNRRPSPFLKMLEDHAYKCDLMGKDLDSARETITQHENRIASHQAEIASQKEKNHRLRENAALLRRKLKRSSEEARLFGDIYRRPKGFAYVTSPKRAWASMKRHASYIITASYLIMLTACGQFLERCWNYWRHK